MKKRIFVVAVCASVLCGCGSSTASGSANSAVSDAVEAAASENTETVASESTETAASETSEEAAESTQKVEQTEPLTVYLNDFDAVIPDLFKEKTGYDVEVVTGNGAETMSRIEAEKGNPQWDVVWMDSMYDIWLLRRFPTVKFPLSMSLLSFSLMNLFVIWMYSFGWKCVRKFWLLSMDARRMFQ